MITDCLLRTQGGLSRFLIRPQFRPYTLIHVTLLHTQIVQCRKQSGNSCYVLLISSACRRGKQRNLCSLWSCLLACAKVPIISAEWISQQPRGTAGASTAVLWLQPRIPFPQITVDRTPQRARMFLDCINTRPASSLGLCRISFHCIHLGPEDSAARR